MVVLTDYRGMSVSQMNALRGILRKSKSGFHVVPNSQLSRAVDSLGWGKPADAGFFSGPTAVVCGRCEPPDLVRTVQDASKASKLPAIKGGYMDGRPLTAAEIEELGRTPSRQTLNAMLVGALAAPMAGLAGVLRQKVASLVYVLKAAENKKSGAPQ